MTNRKMQSAEPPPLALKKTRSEVETLLTKQIAEGRKVLELPFTATAYEDFKRTSKQWDDRNELLLRQVATNDDLYHDYIDVDWPWLGEFPDWTAHAKREFDVHKQRIANLESILGKLDLIEEQTQTDGIVTSLVLNSDDKSIFVVHGHDEGTKQSVARTLEKLGLRAVILHEQANKGMTLIQKLEHHSDVGFACVILTPDDFGYSNDEPLKPKPRARQNVVFELGFFFGKLRRGRVCCLYSVGVELPSDLDGIGWIELDAKGHWRYDLVNELKAAGYKVSADLL